VEATALGYNHVIHFGLGVQQEVEGQLITTGITEQVADLILEERRNKIVESIFMPCEQPILETPAAQKQQARTLMKMKTGTAAVGGLRRSTRQKAKVCSVPVSKRASHRLIKAFEVTGPNDPTGEEALEEFAKVFSKPLSKAQIDAVRWLTSLDSGAVMEATAQLFRRPVSASQDSVMLVRFGVACGYGALSVGCCFELGSLQSSVVSADALVALVTVSGSRCGMSRNGGRMYPVVLLPCSKAWS
jgi:hypothetical protein